MATRPHPYPSGRVVSGRDADGRLETFAAGPDGVWHAWQTAVNGTRPDWAKVGGPADAQLAMAPNEDGRIEVFGTSSAGVHHMWQNGFSTWSDWAWLNSTSGPPLA